MPTCYRYDKAPCIPSFPLDRERFHSLLFFSFKNNKTTSIEVVFPNRYLDPETPEASGQGDKFLL